MSERYIAAVEISSSKIIASVGKATDGGQLDVIAVEHENGVEGVRYGVIQNLEETSVKLARLLRRLEQRPDIAPRKISGLIVGLSGISLKNISAEVSLNMQEGTEVTEEILTRLRQEALRKAIGTSLEVVDAVPRIYHVGKTETHTPKGTIGNHIQATYDLIVCRPELKRNLSRTIPDKLGIPIEGFVVTALATGHLILTQEEKHGCMLVDMGAETTTVTIYKNGNLIYFATLPLGGRNITKDIMSLGVLEERADDIKLNTANAIASDTPSSLNLNGVKLSDVSNLVVARAEEIVANIIEQMEYAGVKENDLPGGIVCIGGAARLKGMMDLLKLQSNMEVRAGQLPAYVRIDDPKASSAELTEVVSVMYAGATFSKRECLEMPASMEVPRTGTAPVEEKETPEEEGKKSRDGRRSRLFDSFTRRISTIFGNPEDNSDELIE